MLDQYIKILKLILDAKEKYEYAFINISFVESSSHFEILLDAIKFINELYNREILLLLDNSTKEYKDYKIKFPKYNNDHIIKIIRV